MHAFSVVEDGGVRISQIRFLGGRIILDITVVYSLSSSLNPQYISISVALKFYARGRLGKKCPVWLLGRKMVTIRRLGKMEWTDSLQAKEGTLARDTLENGDVSAPPKAALLSGERG